MRASTEAIANDDVDYAEEPLHAVLERIDTSQVRARLADAVTASLIHAAGLAAGATRALKLFVW